MPVNIARVRFWIVALAVALLIALVAFFIYARYKTHRAIADLPGKLGAEIIRESNGFTYSQSVKGRTAFTIHASKAVQYKASNLTLRDVVITLYGAQGDRSDRIAGSEFNYDQKAGIVTAKGEVQIDLQGVAAGAAVHGIDGHPTAPPKNASAPVPEGVIHVRTSGLVFDQGAQLASTSQYVEFSTPKGSGHATGAFYDVPKGLLVLDSTVELDSDHEGSPVAVHAAHAEFLRGAMQASLQKPVTTYKSNHTSAEEATLHFRQDGSADYLDAHGRVQLKTDDGKEMAAGRVTAWLDQHSQPERAEAFGGLNYSSTQGTEQMRGSAEEGSLKFSSGGVLTHAQARRAVTFVDVQQGFEGDLQGSATREIRANQMDVDFLAAANNRAAPSRLLAAGTATAVLRVHRTKGPSQDTTIKADQLLTELRDGRTVKSLQGDGHTSVLDLSPNGASSLSTAQTLTVNFSPATEGGRSSGLAKSASASSSALDSGKIRSVVQEGNVAIVQTSARGKGSSGRTNSTHVTANRADYDASSQLMRLTGAPRIDDGAVNLSADAIDYRRDTAIAHATGNVKATYLSGPGVTNGEDALSRNSPAGFGSGGPTHVIAASAVLDQGHGTATFRSQARLWQGANSVNAPVIELIRSPETLKAYSEPPVADAVTTVISSSSGTGRQPGIFRVQSRRLVYDDSQRLATFSGGVKAEQANGTVRADQVQAFLTSSGQGAAAKETTSRVDRVVADGHVELEQPGRRGSGDRLLYTGGNGRFVLTGTPANPPRLYDQVHGNVTGDSLIFNSQDDSVSVTGGQSRAVTDTRTAR